MFYDYNLMNSNTLGVVWCYANKQKIVSDNVGIPKICSTIEKWVDHDGTRRGRLSLRTSTLLLNGTARLYKEELDKLYQDCIQVESQMLHRRSPNPSATDNNSSDSIEDEELSRNSNRSNKWRKTVDRRGNSKNNSVRSYIRCSTSTREFDSNETNSLRCEQSQNASYTSLSVDKRDADVQTTKSYIAKMRERDRYKRKEAFDVNVPMGVIMVYDEVTRLPSKIICANVNKNVKLL